MVAVKRDAEVVVLKRAEECVREFHRYAAKLKARGRLVNCGDRLIAYRVDSTIPDGPVLVTDTTEFVFSN